MWFERAAARGDADAREALASLGAATASPAEAAAPAAAPSIPAAAPSINVKQTQRVLARLGYYHGPADGYANVAYRTALAAYQRDLAAGPRPHAPEP
jgi:peptidoglycan hydrolase-like protein with peptidoglycan-binding domain